MCGIAAIFNYRDRSPVDRAEMRRMLDHMQRRGPDGSGEWSGLDGAVSLGHRRLAIIDLSENGAQPMLSADGQTVVSFNGEIYNYRELRRELEAQGRRFHSASDTEVLLHLYQVYGRDMLPKLRGMFAFALWDENRRGLLLARDPFGIKPLYYADNGKTLRAASQVKTLLAGGQVDTTPEPAGHVGFFLWGNVPAPFTLYKGVACLPAGSSLWVDEKNPADVRSFFSIPEFISAAEQVSNNSDLGPRTSDLLRSALVDSVRHHLIADVPVGVFLSSGLDSTVLTALAAETSATLRTVTLGFEEFRGTPDDETPLAEKVAAQYGARHQTIWITRQDFRDHFARLMLAMDQPSCDGINSYFISRAAAQAGLKVALSGLGGDELFGGYPSFKQIPRLVSRLKNISRWPALNRTARVVSAPLVRRLTSPKYAGLLEYGGTYGGAYMLRRGMFMPWELSSVLDPDMVRNGWEKLETLTRLETTTHSITSPGLRVSALEMTWYMRHQLLRDTDWASMDHSVEVRTPLVDTEVLRQVVPLLLAHPPADKQAMARTPKKQLPDEVLNRPKTGFVVPVREWLAQEDAGFSPERGLRGWSRMVYQHFNPGGPGSGTKSSGQSEKKRLVNGFPSSGRKASRAALVLVTDAFGGLGGIAKFNRDFLTAVAGYEPLDTVVALPRIMPHPPETLPPGLDFRISAVGGKGRFMRETVKAAREMKRRHGHGLVICGHINLLPAAALASRILGSPLVLIIHGVDAWQPAASRLSNRLVRHVDRFISVSELTAGRFASWSKLQPSAAFILPNSVDIGRFGPGPKSDALLTRYGLQGKKVIMTFGRLASEERYKGFDEVLEILPELFKTDPNLAYLICGDGADRQRLEQKAADLGVRDRVVFAGRIEESEKADHYRLADAYVMPSSGEGFGIVYLEAMACGIPVVGSKVDGSCEALRHGQLGLLVDPRNPEEILAAIGTALNRPRCVPEGLEYFSRQAFDARVHGILDELLTHPDQRDGVKGPLETARN